MENRITENGLEYILVGDYYIPNLALPEEHRSIGRWGRMHRDCLKEHHPIRYDDLILSGELWTYLADLNEQTHNRLDCIIDQMKAISVNVLSSKDVFVQEVGGNHIIVINVPRAERSYKPVYVDGNPLCSYRRNGEGDYRCNKEEYQAMVRDASVKTQDMLVLNEMDMTMFNKESIRSYRQRMRLSRPGHVWEALEDEDFLLKLGAVGIGSDGKKHPTSAGLLMFGNEYDIVREYNAYFLDYQEQYDADTRWTDRIISSSGDWSGNVYDFYFRVYNKLTQDIKVPFKMDGGTRVDDTAVHQALREALANCLVNADYYGRQGLVIIKKRDTITMSNPGGFRIEIDTAKSGGISDPRNGTMLKMFNMINIGERAGSGIPNIFRVWREQGWAEPVITEVFEPARITLSLTFEKIGDKRQDERDYYCISHTPRRGEDGGHCSVYWTETIPNTELPE